ncbi:MAG: autotransporter-associated beta strand repeat-containing protein [Kiritimatiellaeota bacterium]|nr:autotransporter-associated beta strand repeat-containing protein [Kiritimatiellota bacterium]
MNTYRMMLGAVAVVALAAQGQVDWMALEADWNVASNWNGGEVPSNVVARVLNGGTAVVGEDVPKVSALYVGCVVSQTAYSGTVLQTNGAVTIAGGSYPLLIGYYNTTGRALYDLAGGRLTVTGSVLVASAESRNQSQGTGKLVVRGDGVFEQPSGLFYVAHFGRTGTVVLADSGSIRLDTGTFVLGDGPPENVGTLEVSGGSLAAPRLEMSRTGARAIVDVSGGSLWLDAMTAGGGAKDVLLRDCTLGAFSTNGVWSAPMALGGTVTFYTGDGQGAPRMNEATELLPGGASVVVENAPGQAAPGRLTLAGTGAYAGSVTVKDGNAFGVSSQAAVEGITGAVAFTDGGRLVFSGEDVVTNSLSVVGALESVAQEGGGTLVLTNAQPVYAAAVADRGVMRFTSAAAIPGSGGSVFINAGGAVAADGAYPTVTAWLDSGRIAEGACGALALGADSSEAIDLTTAGGGLYDLLSLGAEGDVTYSGALTPLGGVYRLGGGNGTLTYASAITGGSVIIDGGASAVVLAAANTSGGGVTVASGTLEAAHPDALGGGALLVSNGVFNVNAAVNAPGGIVVTDTGRVRVVPGGSVDGPIENHAYDNFNTAGLLFDGAGGFTHTGDVSGTGLLAVIGEGTLRLDTPGQVIEQGNVFVGNNGSAGHLEMAAGEMRVNDWLIVACGAAEATPLSTFTLSGGTVTKTNGASIVGDRNSATTAAEGRMTICGDGAFRSERGDFSLGWYNGTGILTMDGGTFAQSNGTLYVGCTGTGTLEVVSGEMVLDWFTVGYQNSGTVNQTGGHIRRETDSKGDCWRIADDQRGTGVYNLSGGTLDAVNATLWIGGTGRGTLNQSGGAVRIGNGWPTLARWARSVGVYNLSGGTFTQTGDTGFIVGEAGTGTLTVSGTGRMELSGGYGLIVGHTHASCTGTVNLATGGLISAVKCQKYGNPSLSHGVFNFDGGTLRAQRDNSTIADFMQGLSAAYVLDGGAVFDTSNNVVTVAQGLLSGAAQDGGLTKRGSGTLILSGTNTYNGATTVDGGTLRLRHADALPPDSDVLVRDGHYDLGGNTITNATVTIENGTVLNGTIRTAFDVTGTGELLASVEQDSGLTKSGDGTLTLYSPPQQYTGPTRVTGGTLRLSAARDALIYYDFDPANVNGTTVRNLGQGGPAYDGILHGAPPLTDGPNGHAITIAHASRAIVTATPVPLPNAFTFAVWVKSLGPVNNAYQRIIHNAYTLGGYLGTDGNNRLLGIIAGKDLNASAQPTDDTEHWHHLAMTWDGGTMTLYHDGAPVHTKNYPGTDAALTNVIAFGHNTPPGNGEFWNGLLAEAHVFDHALSAPNVNALSQFSTLGRGGLLPDATTLELANGASVALDDNMDQTIAALSGDGSVTGGVLTVTGAIAPGGDNAIGTLTLSGGPVLTGTLQIDADPATADRLNVLGPLDISQLTLELTNPAALDSQTEYEIITCAPCALTGTFADITGLPPGWRVRYDRAQGKVLVLAIKGTLILLR